MNKLVSIRSFSFLLIALIFSLSSNIFAQQWTTNGNNIYNANSGNVGIGVINPIEKLEVNGIIKQSLGSYILHVDDATGIILKASRSDVAQTWPAYLKTNGWGSFSVNNGFAVGYDWPNSGQSGMIVNGNVGIGTQTPTEKLEVNGNIKQYPGSYIWHVDDGTGILLKASRSDAAQSWPAYLKTNGWGSFSFSGGLAVGYEWPNSGQSGMIINGKVGIGTQVPGNYMLAVTGNIHAYEVVVETGWADFVFEKDYKLMPLNELETYINKNKHLPEIPTATEVEQNGVSLGETQSKLLQKIEELTLYVIEQNKQIKELQEENKSIKEKLNSK